MAVGLFLNLIFKHFFYLRHIYKLKKAVDVISSPLKTPLQTRMKYPCESKTSLIAKYSRNGESKKVVSQRKKAFLGMQLFVYSPPFGAFELTYKNWSPAESSDINLSIASVFQFKNIPDTWQFLLTLMIFTFQKSSKSTKQTTKEWTSKAIKITLQFPSELLFWEFDG